MPFAINATADVLPLRPDDAVRIGVRTGFGAIEQIELDLSARNSSTHCLVALPALPNVIPGGADGIRLWMTAAYDDAAQERRPFIVFVASYRDGTPLSEERVRFFAGPEETRLNLALTIPAEADRYQLVLYADRRYAGMLRLGDPRLLSGTTEYRIGPGQHLPHELSLERRWRQEGDRVVCSSVLGEYWAQMPAGWRLDEVHPAALAAADWILFAELNRLAFGVSEPAPDPEDAQRRYIGPNTLLSYSLGTDSTAALTLLPDDGSRYYCQRAFRRYFLASGAEVGLPDPAPWDERLHRLPNTTIVPNTFELARIAAGARLGFAHNYGYAAIGLLLADHLDAGVLAFGSVMEQVFLRSGHLFADVVALDRSAYNALRRLLNAAGLFLGLPTAGCSEVLTSRISETGRYAGLAISCPLAARDGTPCRRCFKCFRKMRLDGRADAPDPEESVVKVLAKYPLKSATSVVYAAQRSGYRHPAVDPYLDLDLRFLERYFDYALEHMLPPELASHFRDEFAALAIEPMTDDEELRLRTIGQTFWPEKFSWKSAGIAEPEAPG